MTPWLVLLGLLVVAGLFVVAPVAGATFAYWRGPRRVRCPVESTEARVRIDAGRAALGSVVGRAALAIVRCSLWPRLAGCRQACLDAGPPARPTASAAAGTTRSGAVRMLLVPLDGTAGSESVLGTVAELARAQGARVRFLRVAPAVDAVRAESRVVAYADQETARVEQAELAYLRSLAAGLPGVAVDAVVRFGDPATEIVGEAEAQGADLIAMATHRRGVSRFLRGSLADAVERETTIPVLRVPYGEAAYV